MKSLDQNQGNTTLTQKKEVLAPGLTPAEESALDDLSPFEVTNYLIKRAEASCRQWRVKGRECQVLNAGRGNPNFLNTTARKAYAKLSLFATEMAERRATYPALGFQPEKPGIAAELNRYFTEDQTEEVQFLREGIQYAEDHFQLDPDEFVLELVNAALGDFYPEPPRILENIEKVVYGYLEEILLQSGVPRGRFDLFATEGATSAMNYVFKSLMENKILHYGDRVATVTPIFAPYLEIPCLEDFQLVNMEIKEDEEQGWQIPANEIAKLADPEIKVLYLVNPTNPTAVGLSPDTIDHIVDCVRQKRPDLIVVDDTVYATFVDKFYSLVGKIPENTICIYSYSKYFGVTGWRLGTIMLHEHNIIDQMIANLPAEEREELVQRYGIISTEPEAIKFIDRLEIDSRDVALAHTGGLSGPQQVIMCIFSLFELLDREKMYKQSIINTLDARIGKLYGALPQDFPFPKGGNKTHYYAMINLEQLAQIQYGEDFARYLTGNFLAIDFLVKLAAEKALICLPGKGFSGPEWALRVSLANLHDEVYPLIGQAIMEVLADYYAHYQAQGKRG